MRDTWNIRKGVVPWGLRAVTPVVTVEPGQRWVSTEARNRGLVYTVLSKADGKLTAMGSDGKVHRTSCDQLRRRFRLAEPLEELSHG